MSIFGFKILIFIVVRGKLSVEKYTEKGSKSPIIIYVLMIISSNTLAFIRKQLLAIRNFKTLWLI